MHVSDLIEVVCAAHLSFYVDSPFHERGGLMLVGPPGVLKSTFLTVLDQQYHDAVMMSDVNAKTLTQLRDAIASETIRTLVLPEFGKLYERQATTAANVEGVLRAMVAEGFQAASFDDQRINRLRARAMLMGGLTPATQNLRFTGWEETGFNRRFLWSLIRLADPDALERAVVEWKLVNFQAGRVPQPPLSGKIPQSTTHAERMQMRTWVKYQPGGSHTLHLQLLVKIVCVLRWWYGEVGIKRNPMDVVARFAKSLGREGTTITFPATLATNKQMRAMDERERQVVRESRRVVALEKSRRIAAAQKKDKKAKPKKKGARNAR